MTSSHTESVPEFCDCDPQPIPDEEHEYLCPACGKQIELLPDEQRLTTGDQS